MESRVLEEDPFMPVTDECGDMPQGRRRPSLHLGDTRYLSALGLTLGRTEAAPLRLVLPPGCRPWYSASHPDD